MTNGEKFKSATERYEMFKLFCGHGNCANCPLKDNPCDGVLTRLVGFIHWLELEAEEEKPMPCPYCGSDTDIEYTSLDCDTEEWYGVRCLSCEYVSKNYHLLKEAIAAHNRVCKAVAAYKASEVK